MTRTLFTNIGQLVTNDPQFSASGAHALPPDVARLGLIHDAALVIDNGVVLWAGTSAAAEISGGHDIDEVIDCAGRAIIPGYVDSHTHLVFSGDRVTEFEARMAGRTYAAGGIRETVLATRLATADELRLLLATQIDEMVRQGTTTVEVKSGYHLTTEGEALACELAREVTDEVTFLGAHVVPPEFDTRDGYPDSGHPDSVQLESGTEGGSPEMRRTREGYLDLVCGEMLDRAAPHARWIDVFCDDGAFSVHEARRVLEAGIARGLLPRLHAAQLGSNSQAIALGIEMGCASIDHCAFLTDRDIEALAHSETVVTLLPGVEFSTRTPYPDARRLIDAGITVAISTDCNPGSSYTSSMPFCIALAVREMNMTIAEAVWSATAGGARALRRHDVGRLSPGARADCVELDAPSYAHVAYRPGTPLTRRVWKRGVDVAR